MDRQPRKDATMSDLKLGEPIPTGIPGVVPVSSTEIQTEMQDVTEASARPFNDAVAETTAAYSGNAVFDEVLLFPMKLSLSIALASMAMLVSPALMAKRLETIGVTR
jgi:hypothetical protein